MLERWGIERSMFANANFRAKDAPAFEPADFLGYGDYAARCEAWAVQRMKDAIDLQRVQRSMLAPLDEANVPEWAKGGEVKQ